MVGPDISVSSRQPPLLEPEKRFALDLCWSSSSIKSNIIHSTHFFRTIAPDICSADQTHFESKVQNQSPLKKKMHIHMLFVAFLFFFLSISVQIGGALKLLFPPVIVFIFFYFGQIKQLWSERQGCMRDGNHSPWVKWSLVFTSHAIILK